MQFTKALGSPSRPLLISAPLAGITHRGFRAVVEHFGGCDYHFNEMISVDSFGTGSQYERYYLDGGPDTERCVLQIIGSETEKMVAGARFLNGIPSAGVDINMGCSAPALAKKGSGVTWQLKPDLALDMVKRVRDVLPDRGLSVKLRLPDGDLESFVAFCRGLADAGAEALTFHPRTQSDPWARPARRRLFALVAKEVPIPVVCNGDLLIRQDLDEVGQSYHELGLADPSGFMIGRGAVARPWIFDTLLNGKKTRDRLALAELFHQELEAWQPTDFWPSRAKRFHAYFCQTFAFGNRIASRIQSAPRYGDILAMVRSYLDEHPTERYESS